MHMNRLNPGDIIALGSYPQGSDGQIMPINWQVLDVREDRALLLSRDILDVQPFADTDDSLFWNDSHLRHWLADIFAPRAFTPSEQARIHHPDPVADDSSDRMLWQLFGMEDVTDSLHDAIFALSRADILTYFPSKNTMFCPGASSRITDWVAVQYEDTFCTESPCWWLRSASASSGYVYIVSPCDSIGVSMNVSETMQGVRPALWLRLN